MTGLTHTLCSFEAVIIDEAAQAVELDTLIPLRYGCRNCILVGDPLQLPATVISRRAVDLGYSRSLFARLEACGFPSHMLSEQVWMVVTLSRCCC